MYDPNNPYSNPNPQQQFNNPQTPQLNFNNANPQMFNQFGGFQQFQNNFNNFVNNFNNKFSMSPQQMVQQALDTGQMSPQQFAELRRMANAMTGMNY
jgi:hypothetical protein